MTEFLLFALLGATGIALIAGPLGSFVVWKRMSYLGDTLAHCALLGVALALFSEINLMLAVVFICVLSALLLWVLQKKTHITTDALLGILSHSSLALGLVLISLFAHNRVDLSSYLFGDLLAITAIDIAIIFALFICSSTFIIVFWRKLLLIAADESLAKVEGINVAALNLGLMLLLAIVIAVAMKIVGVLLITAMLIIPAAASRRLSTSPEAMAMIATLLGVCSALGGLTCSYFLDTPTGASIVVCASGLFGLSFFIAKKQ